MHSAILDDWAVFSLNQVLVLGPPPSRLVFAKRAKSKKSVRGSSEALAVCSAPGRLVAVDMNHMASVVDSFVLDGGGGTSKSYTWR